MLTSCPDCNGLLSSEAPTCPHCGYQPPQTPCRPEQAAPQSQAPEYEATPAPPPLRRTENTANIVSKRWADKDAILSWHGRQAVLFGAVLLALLLFILMVVYFYIAGQRKTSGRLPTLCVCEAVVHGSGGSDPWP